MKIPVVGLGAGGHAKVVIDTLQQGDVYELIGLLDPDPELTGKCLLGVPILGGDERLKDLHASGIQHFFVGVGGTLDMRIRLRLFQYATTLGLKPISAIHPQSVISSAASLGRGVVAFALTAVNAGAVIGDNVILNTGSIVEHDCLVGDHVHISPGACLAGGVQVGAGAVIGARSIIREGLRIGTGAVVGAGAAVIRDVPDKVVVTGVPATVLRPLDP